MSRQSSSDPSDLLCDPFGAFQPFKLGTSKLYFSVVLEKLVTFPPLVIVEAVVALAAALIVQDCYSNHFTT